MSGKVGCERRRPCRRERGKSRVPGAMSCAGAMEEQKHTAIRRGRADFRKEDRRAVQGEAPLAQMCRGSHGNSKNWRAATLAALSFSKPRPVQLADRGT